MSPGAFFDMINMMDLKSVSSGVIPSKDINETIMPLCSSGRTWHSLSDQQDQKNPENGAILSKAPSGVLYRFCEPEHEKLYRQLYQDACNRKGCISRK